MIRSAAVSTLALSAVLALVQPAAAGYPFHSEEYERKVEEIEMLAARGLYGAAETKYSAVTANDDFDLGPELYLIGAEVARATGNIAVLEKRLTVAVDLGNDAKAADWLSQVRSEYGAVEIESKGKGMRDLRADPPPFSPDHAAAVSFAKSQMLLDGKFEGFLPAGHYVLASAGFDVVAGGERFELKLNKKGEAKGEDEPPEPVDEGSTDESPADVDDAPAPEKEPASDGDG